jgi:hypothetical protein
MPPAGTTDTDFSSILDQIDKGLTSANASAEGIYLAVTKLWNWLPPWLRHDIEAALKEMWHLLQKLYDTIKEFVLNPGWPPALWHASETWTNQVGATASLLAGDATLNEAAADDHWQGAGATAYKNTLPAQAAALNGIKTMTDALDTALKGMAIAIVGFWILLAAALVTAIIEFTGEEAAADTGVAAPAAIVAFCVSVVKVIAVIVAAVGALWGYTSAWFGPYASINQQAKFWGPYPQGAGTEGSWPPATTADTSDGSYEDGDQSDWRYLA